MKCRLCEKWYKEFPLTNKDGEEVHKIDEHCFSGRVMCAFEGPAFDEENWNCSTMNILRDIAEQFYVNRDDMNNASIGIIPIPEIEHIRGGYIVMTWYKDRGATGQAYIMCDELKPVPLDKETAEATVEYYGKNNNT
jgi:hypothetical protein